MFVDYLKLAVHSLRTRSKRTWLTMIGIFIGIAAVVALISLGQGMESAVTREFTKIGFDKIFVQASGSAFMAPGATSTSLITDSDVRRVKHTNGISRAAGIIFRPLNIEFNDLLQTQLAHSMSPDNSEADLIIEMMSYEITDGRLLRSEDRGKVMLGADLASDAFFGKEVQVGKKMLLNGKEFEVIGVLKKIGDPGLDRGVVLAEEDFRELLGNNFHENEYSMIYIQTVKGADVDKAAADVRRSLRRARGEKEGEETFEVRTASEYIDVFMSVLAVVQVVLVGIALISLLVGGIGIMNTMYTAVLERTQEIGVMKAIGARNTHILLLFLIESGLLGLAGGAIGIAIGFTMSKTVEIGAAYAFGPSLIEAYFPWYLIVGALVFSFIVGALSGVLPARQAASLKPVEALRYE